MSYIDEDFIATLFRHNLWANRCLFEACTQLTEQQLATRLVGMFRTIHETLEHVAVAERSYLYRVRTRQPYPRPPAGPLHSVEELVTWIQESGEGFIAAASTVQATDKVIVDWEGSPREVPLPIFLTQAINHATEHRTQIMATLYDLGIEPPDTDAWSYFDSMDNAE